METSNNMLYKVILVDDEAEVRSAIARKINWEAIGFCLIGEADNGSDALELVARLQPDVVMTDIKMPFMDGMDLARELQKTNPAIKVAIFSGFDDFEYAKEAISLGVTEYILKPIGAEELTKVFLHIKDQLDTEITEKRNMEMLSRHYEESLPVMRQQLLFQLLSNDLDLDRLSLKLKQYNLNIDAPAYVVAAICYDEKTLEENHNLVAFSLQKIIQEYVGAVFTCHFLISMDYITVIIQLPKDIQIQAVIERMNQIFLLSQKLLGSSISIGLGSICTDLASVHKSYEEAVSALEYQVLMEPGQCIYIGDIEPGTMDEYSENSKLKDEVIRQIKIGTPETLDAVIETFLQGFRQPHVSMSQYQIIRLELSAEIIKLCQVYQIELAELEMTDLLKEHQNSAFNSLSQTSRWLKDHCLNLQTRIRCQRKDSTTLMIEQAKDFIVENYCDKSLSAENICKQLNVSPAYFSTIFKKETGLTFVSYLTQQRIEKALEYLNTTDMKTYEIAEKVGYSDPNYFSSVFKKETGVAPSRYRKVNLGNDESRSTIDSEIDTAL